MSVKKKVIILVSICVVILIGAVVADRIIGKNYFMGSLWFVLSAILLFSGYFGIPMKARKIYRRQLPGLIDKNGKFWKRTKFTDECFTVEEPNNSASFKYAIPSSKVMIPLSYP